MARPTINTPQENYEKHLARAKRYRENNREKVNKCSLNYYYNNKEQILKKRKEKYYADKKIVKGESTDSDQLHQITLNQ